MLQGKKAYICSPLSAPNPEGMQHNMELAKYYLMQMKRLYHCRRKRNINVRSDNLIGSSASIPVPIK